MFTKAAWAIRVGLILGSLLASGCCNPWGAPAPYPSGYGPAYGAPPMTAAPPTNYNQNLSTTPGWRPASGAAGPAATTTVTP